MKISLSLLNGGASGVAENLGGFEKGDSWGDSECTKNSLLIAHGYKSLDNYLRRHRRAALLFSGGLDSSLLLAAAARPWGRG